MTHDEVVRLRQCRYRDEEFRQQLDTESLLALQEFDLTEAERQEIVLPNLGWVINQKLAGMSRPRTVGVFSRLKAFGVGALVVLREQPPPTELVESFDLRVEHLPIVDFTAPSLEQIRQAVSAIDKFIDDGFAVGVHCEAGFGRTGTILAC